MEIRRPALAALALAAATLLAACTAGPAPYTFHDVDHAEEARALLPGCARELDDFDFPTARSVVADVDGDGRPDRATLAFRRGDRFWPPTLSGAQQRDLTATTRDGFDGVAVTTASGRTLPVQLRGYAIDHVDLVSATHLQTAGGRLYAVNTRAITRIDAGALRTGRARASVLSPTPPGAHPGSLDAAAVDLVAMLPHCRSGRDAVAVRTVREGDPQKCPFGVYDIHAPQQAALWVAIDDRWILVRTWRIEDADLGCNS